jgi:hypothetical protein
VRPLLQPEKRGLVHEGRLIDHDSWLTMLSLVFD